MGQRQQVLYSSNRKRQLKAKLLTPVRAVRGKWLYMFASILSAVGLGTVIIANAATAGFSGTVTSTTPTITHTVNVPAAGTLTAVLTDTNARRTDSVRLTVSLIDSKNVLVKKVDATSARQKITLTANVVVGKYTIKVSSLDKLTKTGTSYTLSVTYPDVIVTPPPPPPTPVPTTYSENLARIKGVTAYRNTNEDNSPYKATPSASLPLDQLYGPRTDYLNNPAGNPEQDFPTPEGGQNRTACEFSHFAYDDPLVYPNQPGKAHLHMFFGNTDTNAFTTYNTLLNTGGGTCNGMELNRTGYWVPAMFDGNGNVRIPERVVVYYKGEGLSRGLSIPYPDGAAMIANQTGDVNTINNGLGGADGKFSFTCSDQWSSPGTPEGNTIPNCDGSKFLKEYGVTDEPHVVLEMNVKFPQCWSGANANDFRNSYSIPQAGSWYFSLCEGAFSKNLPNLEYFVNYRVEIGEDTSNWFLSSDVNSATFTKDKISGSTVHGDWWGGWNKTINQTWIDNCVNYVDPTGTPSGCGFGYLTNGGPDGNNPLPGPALKYRKQYTGPNKVSAQTVFKDLCTTTRTYVSPASAAYCNP